MVRIAICDDEAEAVSRHAEIVRSALQRCGVGFELKTYTRSDNLLYDITDDHIFYDLLLLDIEMPGFQGMELCGRVKPFLPNVKVIFITSHIEYAIDAYELAIFRYIPKSDLAERLPAAISEAARLTELEAGQEYIIRTGVYMEKIPYRDIFYIQRDGGKNAVFYTTSGTSNVRKPLQQVFDELNAPEFLFIDRGIIVNLIHIMKISGGTAVLKNGEKLPVSRSRLQEVKRKINRFWGTQL
ncbi:MAG: LytTR family DNA-binding domain-containing protein [bacterium]|nr:LytTR family DNA-binding domain-containing protein [bacterium]